jgi:hypothetical protein
MLTLFNQIMGLIGTIAGGIVAALAVQDPSWKKRSVAGIILLGVVQLLLLVLTWEESHNTTYLVNAFSGAWNFVVWLVGTFALQGTIILASGGILGWFANEGYRKRSKLLSGGPDKRVWKSGLGILDWAGFKLVEERHAAVRTNNETFQVFQRCQEKQNEVLVGLGAFAALDENPKEELATARRNTKVAENEHNRAYADAQAAESAVRNVIYSKLEARELLAQGFLPPFTHESEPKVIPADQWRFLRFDESMQNATGQGVTYIGVKVTDPKQRRTPVGP